MCLHQLKQIMRKQFYEKENDDGILQKLDFLFTNYGQVNRR